MGHVSQIFAEHLYDGENKSVLHNRLVEIQHGRIAKIEKAEPNAEYGDEVLRATILAPGFIDIQINGAGDVMFNDVPEICSLETICRAAREGGTAYIMPTFTTAADQCFMQALDAVRSALEANLPGVLGVHIEGPFLSPEKPGIHPSNCIRPITDKDIAALLRPMPGVKLITLAPERQKPGALKALSDAGCIVFAGHSNATAQEMQQAQSQGLSGATHLFNAMSQITVREPGVAGFTMTNPDMFAGIIADGHHVHPLNARMAYDLMGPDRLLLVSDAMQTLAGKSKEFHMAGNRITLQNGKLVDANGTLAGAHLAIDQAVQYVVNILGVPVSDAIKMASSAPAAALGLQAELGKIMPGYRASFTLLDQELSAQGVMVDGVFFETEEVSVESPLTEKYGGLGGHY